MPFEFNPRKSKYRHLSRDERTYFKAALRRASQLSASEEETLACVVEEGPLGIGDTPDRSATKALHSSGLLAIIAVKGQEGFYAADQWGVDVYCAYHGDADDLAEAIAYRKAHAK